MRQSHSSAKPKKIHFSKININNKKNSQKKTNNKLSDQNKNNEHHHKTEIDIVELKREFIFVQLIKPIKIMNKAELIDALANKTGLHKHDAKKALDAYIEIVTEQMSKREEITLIGFGSLVPRAQSERLARNPKTGSPVMIKPRTTVRFKPGKFLLEAINK